MMLDELKVAFKKYAARNDSKEVCELEQIINQAVDAKNLNIDQMEYGKYQVVSIETIFGTGHHLETIVTDGKFLFWVNRGASYQTGGPGIKLFKVIQNFDRVKTILEELRHAVQEEKAITLIYSLLTDESIEQNPRAFVDINHINIAMKGQVIGNCGWTQRKGVVKILSMIHHLGEINDLPDVDSQKWQNALQKSNDIYRDFTTFHKLLEIEKLLYQADDRFKPMFLNEDEMLEIDAIKSLLRKSLVGHDLLKSVMEKLDHTMNLYKNTIYGQQAEYIQNFLHHKVALISEVGVEMIDKIGFDEASICLKKFFQYGYQFEELKQLDSEKCLVGESMLLDL
jgi:hypothetical protein